MRFGLIGVGPANGGRPCWAGLGLWVWLGFSWMIGVIWQRLWGCFRDFRDVVA